MLGARKATSQRTAARAEGIASSMYNVSGEEKST